ncbi:hypothetical protein WR25_10474 [Diploscapter pachys]|uniref:Uncharacterized protein n=1 Tax=Diploscapter pachys TaxID=2018661 RepID=A0A2A2JBC2_9BILA|nr:hypothetical protein WR25_10474 [Diploscapter pachys]
MDTRWKVVIGLLLFFPALFYFLYAINHVPKARYTRRLLSQSELVYPTMYSKRKSDRALTLAKIHNQDISINECHGFLLNKER